VLTQTRPCPPPGAGVAVAVAAPLVLVEEVVAGAVEDEGLAEVFGLKKSESVFFAGEGDGATVGETAAAPFALRPRFSVGEADDSVAAPAEGDVAAVVFVLRVRFSAGEGDASLAAAGEEAALASAFLCDLCLAGDGDAVGEDD
jgi:hypothetical protein